MTFIKTRFTSFEAYLTVIDEIHVTLLKKCATITQKMPPPRLIVEVVSPGGENSENYKRDYQDKRDQYAAIGIPEYWIVDPDRAWVMVGTWVSGSYLFKTFQGDDAIVSPTFPKLKLTAALIFTAQKIINTFFCVKFHQRQVSRIDRLTTVVIV